MTSAQRSFYTVLGWGTWKGTKWYVARRLGLRSKARKGRVLLLAALAVGGAVVVVRTLDGGPGA